VRIKPCRRRSNIAARMAGNRDRGGADSSNRAGCYRTAGATKHRQGGYANRYTRPAKSLHLLAYSQRAIATATAFATITDRAGDNLRLGRHKLRCLPEPWIRFPAERGMIRPCAEPTPS
jgi:hypothetical protein